MQHLHASVLALRELIDRQERTIAAQEQRIYDLESHRAALGFILAVVLSVVLVALSVGLC